MTGRSCTRDEGGPFGFGSVQSLFGQPLGDGKKRSSGKLPATRSDPTATAPVSSPTSGDAEKALREYRADRADKRQGEGPDKIEVKDRDDLMQALHDAMGYGRAT
jgi:hypothetical protein